MFASTRSRSTTSLRRVEAGLQRRKGQLVGLARGCLAHRGRSTIGAPQLTEPLDPQA